MSLPLVSSHIRITQATDAALETECEITGQDKSELIRSVLEAWGNKRIHAVMVLHAKLSSKGLLRDYEGGAGK